MNKSSFLLIFALLTLAQSQYFGWYQSAESFLEQGQLAAFMNVYGSGVTVEDTSMVWSSNQSWPTTASTNLTNLSSTLSYTAIEYTIIPDVSANTIMAAAGASMPITGSITFDFIDQGMFVGTQGNGTATFFSTMFVYNKSVSVSGGSPNIGCAFLIDFGAPGNQINVTLSSGMGTGTVTNIMTVLGELVFPALAVNVASSLYDQCNGFYQSEARYWQSYTNYVVYDPLSLYSFNSQLSLVSFDEQGVVFGVNGTVGENNATADFNSSTFDPSNGDVQYAYSQQFFQAWVQYFESQGVYNSTFNSTNFPLDSFDYTIDDLSNLLPTLEYTYSPNTLLSVNASLGSLIVNINSTTQSLSVFTTASCNVFVPQSNTSVFNFSVIIYASVQAVFASGTINFVVEQIQYEPFSFAVNPIPQPPYGNVFLEYYLQDALDSFKGQPLTYGSSFNIYGAILTNPVVEWNNGYLYLYD